MGGQRAERDGVEMERRVEADLDVPDRDVEDRRQQRRDQAPEQEVRASLVGKASQHVVVIGVRVPVP